MKAFYERDGVTIYHGDCLEVMAQFDGPFDAIIADLPYGTTACSWDTVIPFEPLWEQYKRLTRGAVMLFGSQPFTSALVMSCLEWFRYEWIIEKSVGTGFLDAKKRPLKCHESVSVFYSKLKTYNPQMREVAHRIIKSSRPAGCYGSHTATITDNNGLAYPRSVLYYPKVVKPVHSTQKPVALLAYLIRTYTNPGEIVLDNTMGSGTTLVAARAEGRRAVGIEKDKGYCEIAVERLRQRSLWTVDALSTDDQVVKDHPALVQMALLQGG